MSANQTGQKGIKKFDALIYRSILLVYAAAAAMVLVLSIKFIYKEINAPFSVSENNANADIPQVSKNDLKRVLQKIGGARGGI